MRQPAPQASWWVGLTREQLQQQIAEREPVWHAQKNRFQDYVGATLMRESWEPRRKADAEQP